MQAAAADRFDDALTRMKQRLRGMGERIGVELVEPLAKLAEQLDDLTREGAGNNKVELPWLDKFIQTLGVKLLEAESVWSAGMAKFWQSVGWGAQASRFQQQADAAAANLARMTDEAKRKALGRGQADVRDIDNALLGKKPTGNSFAAMLDKGDKAGKGSKTAEPDPDAWFSADMRKAFDAEQTALKKSADEVARLRDKYIELVDPLQKFRDQLNEINTLRLGGQLTAAQALEAEWRVNEAMDAQLDKMRDLADASAEQKSIAKDLGMTFSSAFEDAIIGGKGFSDVLKGIGDDIARIIVRKKFTEPMANAISGFDFGKLWPFANGGIMSSSGPLPLHAYANGGIASTPQMALFGEGSKNEAFVPLPDGRSIPVTMSGGGSPVVNVTQNISIDSRSDRATIMQAMVAAKDQAKAEIMASMRRGGAFA